MLSFGTRAGHPMMSAAGLGKRTQGFLCLGGIPFLVDLVAIGLVRSACNYRQA